MLPHSIRHIMCDMTLVRPETAQKLLHLSALRRVVNPCRMLQQRLTGIVLRMNVGATLNQKTRGINRVAPRRIVQRRVTVVVPA